MTGVKGANAGEKHGNAKLSDLEALEVVALYADGGSGITQREIGAAYEITQQQVSKICLGQRRDGTQRSRYENSWWVR